MAACLEIGGRLVPCLGFWDPDDVCFGDWLSELHLAAQAMQRPNGRHVFDEGEQGQPAFVFQREGDRAFFTIAASEISDGRAHPDWQRVEFSPGEFAAAYDRFREAFIQQVRNDAPTVAKAWLERIAR